MHLTRVPALAVSLTAMLVVMAMPIGASSGSPTLAMGYTAQSPDLEVGSPIWFHAFLSPYQSAHVHEGWIDFGDGSDPVPISNNGFQSPQMVTHTYQSGGTFTVTGFMEYTACVDPRHSGSCDGTTLIGQGATASLTIRIDGGNTAPSVDAGDDVRRLPSRTVVDVAAAIDDPDAGDSHTALVDWGDGQQEALAVADLQATGSHDYGGRGAWTATVCVSDAAGEESCDSFDVVIDGAHGKPNPEMHPGKQR